MQSTCSRATSRRRAKTTPWSSASARFQPKPIPSTTRPPLRWSRVASSLAKTMGSCCATSATPVPSRMRRVVDGRCGERDRRVEAPPVVVRADPLDHRRRGGGPNRQMGVLGEEERVETARFGLAGEFGGCHRLVGEERGDPESQRAQPPSGSGQTGTGVGARVGEERGVRGLLPLARGPDRRSSCAGEHEPLDLSGGAYRVAGDAPGELHGLVERGSGIAHLERQPRRDGLLGVDPLRGQQHRRGPLPPDPGRQQDAARRLRWDAELGERRPEPGSLLDEDEVHVGEQRAAESDPGTVDRGEQWLVERHRGGRAGPGSPSPRSSPSAPCAIAAISRRSWPEVNTGPRPERTTAPIASSASAPPSASVTASYMAASKAFLTSGRSNATSRTPSSSSTTTRCSPPDSRPGPRGAALTGGRPARRRR